VHAVISTVSLCVLPLAAKCFTLAWLVWTCLVHTYPNVQLSTRQHPKYLKSLTGDSGCKKHLAMLTKYCSNVGHHSYVWEGVLIRLWEYSRLRALIVGTKIRPYMIYSSSKPARS
jgi:hypothetical protein